MGRWHGWGFIVAAVIFRIGGMKGCWCISTTSTVIASRWWMRRQSAGVGKRTGKYDAYSNDHAGDGAGELATSAGIEVAVAAVAQVVNPDGTPCVAVAVKRIVRCCHCRPAACQSAADFAGAQTGAGKIPSAESKLCLGLNKIVCAIARDSSKTLRSYPHAENSCESATIN